MPLPAVVPPCLCPVCRLTAASGTKILKKRLSKTKKRKDKKNRSPPRRKRQRQKDKEKEKTKEKTRARKTRQIPGRVIDQVQRKNGLLLALAKQKQRTKDTSVVICKRNRKKKALFARR